MALPPRCEPCIVPPWGTGLRRDCGVLVAVLTTRPCRMPPRIRNSGTGVPHRGACSAGGAPHGFGRAGRRMAARLLTSIRAGPRPRRERRRLRRNLCGEREQRDDCKALRGRFGDFAPAVAMPDRGCKTHIGRDCGVFAAAFTINLDGDSVGESSTSARAIEGERFRCFLRSARIARWLNISWSEPDPADLSLSGDPSSSDPRS